MISIQLTTCINQNAIIYEANEIIMNTQIKLKEKLLIFNSKKETEYHNVKSKLNKEKSVCKKN